MLMADDMLETLSKEDSTKNYKNCNSDYDFSQVLEFCASNTIQSHTIRFADGQEEEFSFDKEGE